MRIDVITIFPEYLEPMRHALLGKAIEGGLLSVGVHDLRAWATDAHRSVDDTPAGGGPGMVMKPQVWGPALDDVAAGVAGGDLASASPHLTTPRHDDLAGVAPHHYDAPSDVDDRPLLIVPTPAGRPFTQADAQAFSRERHLVFACGRYEGIDQRVFDDAARRYRVREVSIGDYVLIGGEVAALVITEAVVRLIPGVLGNQDSHLDDSFSDGLLEGPSYTRPRSWRGLDVPDVLFSGDHAKIAAWRREQSLKRTRANRPDLLANAELSDADRFALDARDVHTDLNVVLSDAEWRALKLRKKLKRSGYVVQSIDSEPVDFSCQPDTMFAASGGGANEVRRILINGRSTLSDAELTRLVVAALPEGTEWYGSTNEGHSDPDVPVACAWPGGTQ
ncbi:tRNA (guanosine(37)-N1)-methyltransferase TrmD [Corynebacterium uterequi]|uniref:tRNA (guanine-N(1)-)-methyltransferase n=1 Tax=Corynebacterium uterequi TaxID=1072256 RepID=A0A0G3HHG1_9CORY|nr:tRNA (guanosine(37)-N1)-methyltransferase TrmD [Corynebacterium uterequi]AKK11368.1 tRNA-(guanine-N1)-methyltransferase [Corynebacterium uterequi]